MNLGLAFDGNSYILEQDQGTRRPITSSMDKYMYIITRSINISREAQPAKCTHIEMSGRCFTTQPSLGKL
jgi:hypothetical protein